MSRPSSSRRRPASSPGTVSSPSAHRRELSTKRRGELAELAFTLKAASLGFAVSKPYGDSERYDFILDARADLNLIRPDKALPFRNKNLSFHNKELSFRAVASVRKANASRGEEPAVSRPRNNSLHRIQVKCSTQLLNGLYRINAHRRTGGRAVPYLASEIDFLAAFIIPEDTWYIIPIHAVRATSLLFRRKNDRRPGLYDQYREAWHLLRPKR
jgi:hypothetical protein